MFALIVIIFTCFLVVFGMVGWLYFDHQQNSRKIQNYFKKKFDKF